MFTDLVLVPLAPDNLSAFQQLLGRTEFGGCFCAVWTHHDADWEACCNDPLQPNLARTREDVQSGRQAGFLVEHRVAPQESGEIIAWTGAGPKSEFPGLRSRLGARKSQHFTDTWCIGCMAIRADYRGRGVSSAIVAAVMAQARSCGATRVEAYPTDPWDEPRSYRGALSTYTRAGFREVCREADGESQIVLLQASLQG
ncbi:MAG: GNAT family N-acetyltransferase [Planctomycetota bacterium]